MHSITAAHSASGTYWRTTECQTTVSSPGRRRANSAGSHSLAEPPVIASGSRRGDRQRRLEPLEALGLVGPDVGQQAAPVIGERGIQRRQVTAGAMGDPQVLLGGGKVDRRPRAPRVLEAHGRGGLTERHLAHVVGKPVGPEVQPRAGADLQQSQRPLAAVGQPQQHGVQHGGASDLVGLDRARQPPADPVEVVVQRRAGRRPRLAGRALTAGGRIEAREVRGISGQDKLVQGSHQPQLGHRPPGSGDPGEQPGDDAATVHVVGRRDHQLGVQRTAAAVDERPCLGAEAIAQRTVGRRLGHAARLAAATRPPWPGERPLGGHDVRASPRGRLSGAR